MFEGLLVHRVETWRPGGETDRFGQPKPATVPFAIYPCRVTAGGGKERGGERTNEVYETSHEIFVGPHADIREDDEARVLDSAGVEIVPRAQIVRKRPIYDGTGALHHIECDLEVQRGPT